MGGVDDRIVGAVLRALEETGLRDNTIVMFVSDHGMPLPFAKTNCWRHSTRTPWVVRWPGKTKPDSVDATHLVSGIDLAPTLLDALGLPPLAGMDGKSFAPLLTGGKQDGRNLVFTQFHKTAGKREYPMRAVSDRRYGYIYNAWADGKNEFKNESQSGRTMNAMRAAAGANGKIAARVKHFLYRAPEELYDYEDDPDALVNLINDPRHAKRLDALRRRLLDHLEATGDPLAAPFRAHLQRPETSPRVR